MKVMTLSLSTALYLVVAPTVHAASPLPLASLLSDAGIGAENLQEHMVKHHPNRMLDVEAVALLGDVALTLIAGTPVQDHGVEIGVAGEELPIGTDVNGPFEGGFGETQDDVIVSQLGCTAVDTSACYSEGGLDVATAEQICATNCGVVLPRLDTDTNVYYGILDSCGGHTEYHFHRDLTCLYTTEEGSTHSIRLADATGAATEDDDTGTMMMGPPSNRWRARSLQDDSQGLYGIWEDYSQDLLPVLDACNGHYGLTPESPDVEVYHYHLSEHAPFTIGCVGPNEDGSVVTIEDCRDVYDDCSDDADIEIFTVLEDGVEKQIPYQSWCPCYDNSGLGVQGAGLNVGTVANTRTWFTREYIDDAWTTVESGTISELTGFEDGISVVFELPDSPDTSTTDTPVSSAPVSASPVIAPVSASPVSIASPATTAPVLTTTIVPSQSGSSGSSSSKGMKKKGKGMGMGMRMKKSSMKKGMMGSSRNTNIFT